MGKQQFETWLQKLGEAWVNRDPKAAASLFSKDVKYYESALGKHCTSWEEMAKLWKVVPTNQKDMTLRL